MPKIIQFTQLGKFGRFGNQIFQYLFARAYAEKYGATLELPCWVGQKIFKNVNHPIPSVQLRRTGIDTVSFGEVNIDLFGYFQKKQFLPLLSESKIRSWLQFKDVWVERFGKGEYNIVAHLRRGDYVKKYSQHFCIVTEESYITACKKYGLPEDKIIWLREEDQKSIPELDDDIQFLPDFFLMINADVLLRANSTFSQWAGFFNKNKVYSPLIEGRHCVQDVEFVEGNWPSIVAGVGDFYLNP